MKFSSFIFCIMITTITQAQAYQKLHNDAILIDTHNDILTRVVKDGVLMDSDLRGKTHSDLNRWKEGGLDVQIFSVFCDGEQPEPYQYANTQIDALDAVITRNPDKIVKVANSKEMLKAVKQGKIAAMSGIEGGHMIENDLTKLEALYNRGARYMTLTWNNSTDWASSAYDERYTPDLPLKGLSPFGKEVVQKMNSLGMLVDVSHLGEQAFWDVIQTSTLPVFASHSSVYALCQHQRNLNDAQIKAIAKTGGVIQVNFYSGFLDNDYFEKKKAFLAQHSAESEAMLAEGKTEDQVEQFLYSTYIQEADALRAPFSAVIDHIDYIVQLVGIDYVGIGSDFDGIESPPIGLDDVTYYPAITKALLDKGYSKKDIKKILGGNFLRVLKANEKK